MNKIQSEPQLYDYLDATQFLNDVFSFRKSVNPGYSFSVWATDLGFGNKTVLRFILRKERRISPKSTRLLIKDLKLSTAGAEYFEALVSYSQAKSKQEKQSFGATLMKLQRARYNPVELASTQQLCNAISPVVLSLLAFGDVAEEPLRLSQLLNLSEATVQESLIELHSEGLIQKDSSGKFTFNEVGFRIPDRPGNTKLRNYHEYWIDQAKAAIDLDPKIRKFRALKFALTDAEFGEVLDRINDFAIALLATYNPPTLENRRLYMLETLLFPIANVGGKRIEDQAANRIAL
ncbi:MAG: TIGR02147 family protein [Proteobacteria bacterium]|nr:MAG: TIGR02147 family protein [Pseudomonadota bacterium]